MANIFLTGTRTGTGTRSTGNREQRRWKVPEILTVSLNFMNSGPQTAKIGDSYLPTLRKRWL